MRVASEDEFAERYPCAYSYFSNYRDRKSYMFFRVEGELMSVKWRYYKMVIRYLGCYTQVKDPSEAEFFVHVDVFMPISIVSEGRARPALSTVRRHGNPNSA